MEIISIYNLKGGVGKTTSTHSIAAGLSEFGKKVLVIDIDPQSSLTFMVTDCKLDATTKDILLDTKTIEQCINVGDKFDYIGSTLELTLSELELNSTWNKENILKAYQHAVANKYRFFSYGDAMLIDRISAHSTEK